MSDEMLWYQIAQLEAKLELVTKDRDEWAALAKEFALDLADIASLKARIKFLEDWTAGNDLPSDQAKL